VFRQPPPTHSHGFLGSCAQDCHASVLLIADQDAAEHACKRAREHPSRLEQAMATSVLSQGSIVRVERERIGEHIHTNSLFNQRHKSKRKCNRTTMPGSEDGKKLYYAARDGKDEEVERLLKMGVKPDDYKDGVRR